VATRNDAVTSGACPLAISRKARRAGRRRTFAAAIDAATASRGEFDLGAALRARTSAAARSPP
jgi:hypothetical protein